MNIIHRSCTKFLIVSSSMFNLLLCKSCSFFMGNEITKLSNRISVTSMPSANYLTMEIIKRICYWFKREISWKATYCVFSVSHCVVWHLWAKQTLSIILDPVKTRTQCDTEKTSLFQLRTVTSVVAKSLKHRINQ